MEDSLSIAAGLVGITSAALHATRLLLDTLDEIKEAPKTITRLSDDVKAVGATLTLLEGLSDPVWSSLGATVAEHSKATVARSQEACNHFRAKLQQWMKHSDDGKLAWRDRASFGVFRKAQIKATSDELQHCKLTINSVIGVATLYSSVHNGTLTEEIKESICAKQDELKGAMTVTDRQLVVLQDKLKDLELSSDEEEAESTSPQEKSELQQWIKNEVVALDSSKVLFEELLAKAQEEAIRKAALGAQQGSMKITFGEQNSGFQAGVIHGSVSGLVFGSK